ncbi:D-TA family PLP-dependent enzyme [Nocardioides sp. zg-579]|uniref:D-TA family PLP-dependent enzyme n=1 Tax=Nocardioides marmotae TaxID=2663857 RepID=A0A6I3J819_9ACTN|nr:alanine racemase [Nocardioides marmotae]MCR6030814.1 D-TA family PLP-dependent enzyme [Gordonia jinghuaiqii]MTB94449.1 D-TA family PLP-dependent enzyme [Nocardioides marmotae]QKE01530.1 D-TA family PLP-dependent enzyme [Nocardioides marmotae]
MPAVTPFLCVDLDRLRRNVRVAAEFAAARQVALRPHVKTHKSPEIARLQLAHGASGVTVATIGEAELFARHGCEDVFIASPLWLDERAAARVRELAEKATVAFAVDSAAGAANAGRLLGRTPVEVLVEVDSGQHRTGVRPEEASEVATTAVRAGLEVRGVFTFPGHSYAPGAVEQAARDEAAALAAARASLEAAGVEVRVVSGGSTPTFQHTDTSVVTELRPGVYVFNDAQQWELGTVPPDRVALCCRTTVVSHSGGRAVLDAGSKLLGADRAPWATGHGRLPAYPDARVVLVAENRAVVDLGGAPLPRLGSQVDVVPNHVCTSVNLVDDLWVEEAGGLRPWPVAARGLNC